MDTHERELIELMMMIDVPIVWEHDENDSSHDVAAFLRNSQFISGRAQRLAHREQRAEFAAGCGDTQLDVAQAFALHLFLSEFDQGIADVCHRDAACHCMTTIGTVL